MIALRELPARLMPRDKPSPPPFGLHNFCLLEQDDSALVYGLIGRFWQAEYGLEQVADGAGFLAFAQPGVAKLALGYVVSPLEGGRCRLVTETRVFCPDDASRRRFTPYWYAIRLVSGLIRRRMLRAIKTASEKRVVNHSPS